jgi:hypothetical protein
LNHPVDLLVVLYSINVFLTFSMSLAGLCRYWIRQRGAPGWRGRLLLSAAGLLVTSGILVVTVIEKFFEGGWVTVMMITAVIGLCLFIRRHYRMTKARIAMVDRVFAGQPSGPFEGAIEPVAGAHTAVLIVGSSRGGGLHALLWVQRMFPGHFHNFIFVNARTVDSHAYGGDERIASLRAEALASLQYFVALCHSHALASAAWLGFGTDAVDEVTGLCEQVGKEYPNAIFFTSKLIFEHDNWLTGLLHNQAALAIQRRLHFDGLQLVILPMKV